jgi:hypothetical protein
MNLVHRTALIILAVTSTAAAVGQEAETFTTTMGLRGGATFTIHESDDLYYQQSNGWIGGLSLQTDLGPSGSKTWAFMLNASYATYRLANAEQGNCYSCLGDETQHSIVYEEYQTISQVEVSPLLALRIGSSGFELLGGISAGSVIGMSTQSIIRMSDSVETASREGCLECVWIDDTTLDYGTSNINTSSGIRFALVGGLQYVLRIASTEIVPAVLYRYGLSAVSDVNSTMLRAFDATLSLRVPL